MPSKFTLAHFQTTLSMPISCITGGVAWNIRCRNIGLLYEFLMKFNVFIYVMKSDGNFAGGRLVYAAEGAEGYETFRIFRHSARLASLLNLKARAI